MKALAILGFAQTLAAACGGAPSLPTPTLPAQAAALDRARHFADALVLYARACDRGDMEACRIAGAMYARGRGAKHDIERARALYAKACAGKNGAACAAVDAARWPRPQPAPIADGDIELSPLDDVPEPRPHIESDDAAACAAGYAPSCLDLDPPQIERAIVLAAYACAHREAASCIALADAQSRHRIRKGPWVLELDDMALRARAFGIYDRACDAGELGACDAAWGAIEGMAKLVQADCSRHLPGPKTLAESQGDTYYGIGLRCVRQYERFPDRLRAERRARRANAFDCAAGDAFACTQPRKPVRVETWEGEPRWCRGGPTRLCPDQPELLKPE